MHLSDCELIPAVIVDTADEMQMGRIKCVIPGYVDATFSKENMPWVRPLGMTRHQSFSKMMPGYKVWVIANKNNYNEFWYIPFFEKNDVSKNYLGPVYDSDQPEIFMAHNNGGNHSLMTFDEKNGFSERIGNDHINLMPDGHISLKGQNGEVDIDGSKVKMGEIGGDYEPAVLGNKLKDILDKMKAHFSELQKAANSSPYTTHLVAPITNIIQDLSKSNEILSKNVKLN